MISNFIKNIIINLLDLYFKFIFIFIYFHKNNKYLKKLYLRSEFCNTAKTSEFQFFSGRHENYVLLSKDQTISQEVYTNGEFGFSTFLKVINILGPNFIINNFIDIGANCGFYSFQFAMQNLEILAFEPNSDALLKMGIKAAVHHILWIKPFEPSKLLLDSINPGSLPSILLPSISVILNSGSI